VFGATACRDAVDPATIVAASGRPSALAQAIPLARPGPMDKRYIIVLKPSVGDVDAVSREILATTDARAFHVYRTALKGLAVFNLSEAALELLNRHPLVDYIEDDKLGKDATLQTTAGEVGLWGLDRIDQRSNVLDQGYQYFFDGSGVHIYIIDSGIMGGHTQFTGRIGNGVCIVQFSSGCSPTIDSKGHGTAVAGVAAGSTYGVAKGATLHSVRVNDGVGATWTSDVVAGLDWVAQNRVIPAVANLSTTNNSSSVSGAMDGVVASGVVMVLAAGNDGSDACAVQKETRNTSVIVVSATNTADQLPVWANFGSCVDVHAPGVGLITARKDSPTDTAYESGTSIAAPVVAGVAAVMLQEDPTASPATIFSRILSSATTIPNQLLLVNSLHRYSAIRLTSTLDSHYSQAGTWEAYTRGGDPNGWQFQWEKSENGGPFSVVGAQRTYARAITPDEDAFVTLRLTATNLGESLVTTSTYHIESSGLTASIIGDQTVCSAGSYQWQVNATGGNGSFAYQWSVYWVNTGTTQQLGTAQTQSLFINGSEGDFQLTAKVTSAGIVKNPTLYVFNNAATGNC
jgi:subtilisin family serine protease